MKLEFAQHICEKCSKYQIPLKSFQWEPNCCMRMDGRTNMTKLIVDFCNFANALKKQLHMNKHVELICSTVLNKRTTFESITKFPSRNLLWSTLRDVTQYVTPQCASVGTSGHICIWQSAPCGGRMTGCGAVAALSCRILNVQICLIPTLVALTLLCCRKMLGQYPKVGSGSLFQFRY
jgi:hypothetical protein